MLDLKLEFRKFFVAMCASIVPNAIFLVLPYIVIHRDAQFWVSLRHEGFLSLLVEAFSSINWTRSEFWTLLAALFIGGTISILTFGGKTHFGPPTPNGFRPEYTHSGFRYYLVAMAVVVPLVHLNPMLGLYYDFLSLIGPLIAISFVLSLFLYIKGLVAPSPGLSVITGNPLVDFYRGIELYPRIGSRLDLKTLVNCRVCLFLLQIIYLAAWKSNAELHKLDYTRGQINWAMTTVAALQTLYLGKWFYWEDGYKQTIDITTDKLGMYLVSACLVLIPSVYGLYSLFLVAHSPILWFGPLHSAVVFALGLTFIGLTYVTDDQRYQARLADGKLDIWGKPAVVIRAVYKDGPKGKEKKTILLASGFWGLARHINYFFEICLFAAWGLPVAPSNFAMSGGIVIMVTLILLHRSSRDDLKCRKKYGKHWEEYCQRVPYKMIPYVF